MLAAAMDDPLPLRGRDVLLIVGGGIAAYKSVMLARELIRLGAAVETVLTPAAQRFVTGVTFAGITGRPARSELWDPSFPGELHIELTRRASLVIVAPATADLLARMAMGLADDLATTCLLAAKGDLFVAPAMHPRMWEHPATQSTMTALRARGVCVLGPETGPLANGEVGPGRMREPETLARDVVEHIQRDQDLTGLRVLVSAGPTYEAIDPVRFVGNRSSGRMGFAVAERARARGAMVTLVAGPVQLAPPSGVEMLRVRSAIEMRDAIVPRAPTCDVVVMAAAVADYRPAETSLEKIKKNTDELTLRLVRNPDILAELGAVRSTSGSRLPVLVGFAVETHDLIARARAKILRKACDLVVANLAADGFEGDDNQVVLVQSDSEEPLPRMSKMQVADRILDRAKALHSVMA
jgi:phosphopantothenoylcysteine decarboxylase/phosphopantothenate--cysteine ligase